MAACPCECCSAWDTRVCMLTATAAGFVRERSVVSKHRLVVDAARDRSKDTSVVEMSSATMEALDVRARPGPPRAAAPPR